uniref:Integrin subunit alpha 6 n=2 Tax=Balaenoptera musculus TaxID=9771 RepID=A0A8C0E300_BALMU
MNEGSLHLHVGPPSASAQGSGPLGPAHHQHLSLLTGSKRLSGSAPNGNHNSSASLQEDTRAGAARPAARLRVSPPRLPGQVRGGREGQRRVAPHRSRAGREGAGGGRARRGQGVGRAGAGPASSSLDKTPASLQRTTGSFSGRELPARGSGRAESATCPGGGAGRGGERRPRWPRRQRRGSLEPSPERRAAAQLPAPLPVRRPMAAAGRLWLLYLSAGLLPRLGAAFNLDTREDNVIEKTGDSGSLFGFSLAMHWQLQPEDKRLLLVGAPRAVALPLQKANRTGGLYSCDITSRGPCPRIEFDNDADPSSESKEDQWMGVTVQSQGPGGKVVTCAHRYEKRQHVNTKQESRDIFGRCYVLSQNLRIEDDMDGGDWSFCDGRLRGHEKFGSCQQGVAATFTKDFHYIAFGAPGTYNWKGIVRVEQKNNTFFDMNIFEDGPYEVGGETDHDESLVPVPANSYLGFSLDSGKGIVSKDEITFVSGAPRANHSGAVVLLKRDVKSAHLLPEHIFDGEGLASSFGYDVAVVDLNKDGWQDIVIGAPQYFDRSGEVGGAAYVYINQQGRWNNVKPIRLNGTKDSMFGIAVKNIGDINQDGYPDIAVGAPYDGKGKVFIYHGSANGINTKPTQILEGKSPFFGYSIAGNMDLDRNSYPDVAVGSLSDSVTIFRSRPVINIQQTITVTPNRIDLHQKMPCGAPSGICLKVKACFEYTAKPTGYNPSITIAGTLEAEKERRKSGLSSRVQFRNQGSEPKYTQELTLSRQKQKVCMEETLWLQVHFLKEGCGDDNVCNSNLKLEYKFCTREGNQDKFSYLPIQKGVPELVLKDQKDIALEITVTNSPSNPKNPTKDGDDAHEAKLIATFPDTLTYSAYRELRAFPEKQLSCVANQNGSQADCELGNPFKRNSSVTFYLILSTTEITFDTTDLDVNLKLETTSNQDNLASITATARVVIELLLSVSGVAKPSQVYFGGSVIGEQAMKSEEEVGSLIEYEFRVINLGKPLKNLGTATLNIQWPKEISNGKWLLYLVKVESKGLEKIACQPQKEINFLKLKEAHNSRKKREIAERQTDDGRKFSLFAERKYQTLNCSVNVNCVNIGCPLRGLDSKASVVLRSRLWNSTFLEEYSKMNYLDILVRASIDVTAATENIKLPNAGTQVRVTVFPSKTVAQYSGVPWWIILVAILAGILMLALLVFLLWKCGFFKRSRYDDSVPRYHAVRIRKEEREIPDEKYNDNLEKKQWITRWNENESYS